MKWHGFGDHFPSKIDEKIEAKIDADKVMKVHEKTIQKIFFFIEILRQIGCVRKVANSESHIKTNGFLMISEFARFENRFGKLQKIMKNISKQ